jgi:hypothetical protein
MTFDTSKSYFNSVDSKPNNINTNVINKGIKLINSPFDDL